MTAPLEIIGLLLIIIGFLFLFAGSISRSDVKTGGVIVIGPLPIVFGSDRTAILIAVIGAIAIMLLILFWHMI